MINNITIGVIASGYKAPVTSGQTCQVNLTESGEETIDTGWNNLLTGTSGLALLTTNGEISGWFATRSTNYGFDINDLPELSNSDFPDDVINTFVYVDAGDTGTLDVTGTNPDKTYTVKTMSYVAGNPNGITSVTVGGTTQSGDPTNTVQEFTFTNISPDETGRLTISFTGPSHPVMSGYIITEN